MIRVLGHIGVWAGLYAVAAFLCLWQLAGGAEVRGFMPRWEAIAIVFLTASAVYALDRVKLRDAWMDPADERAQPNRFAFLTAHSGAVRSAAAAMLMAAALVGLRLSPWAPPCVALAAGSVIAYAAGPRRERARIKDVLWLKNAYVAAGMTGFVLAVSFAASGGAAGMARLWGLSVAGALLVVRIWLDAAMCDIDDEFVDREFGTRTWATALGRARLWKWTGVGRVALVGAVLAASPLPWPARVAWAGAMVLGMAALRLPRWRRVRDAVDLRFLPEAIMATACLMEWHAVA